MKHPVPALVVQILIIREEFPDKQTNKQADLLHNIRNLQMSFAIAKQLNCNDSTASVIQILSLNESFFSDSLFSLY